MDASNLVVFFETHVKLTKNAQKSIWNIPVVLYRQQFSRKERDRLAAYPYRFLRKRMSTWASSGNSSCAVYAVWPCYCFTISEEDKPTHNLKYAT
jgi:hypothetical protein